MIFPLEFTDLRCSIVDDNILWHHVPMIDLTFLYMVPAVNVYYRDTGKRYVFIPEVKALLNKVKDLQEFRRIDRYSYSTLVDESNDKAIRMALVSFQQNSCRYNLLFINAFKEGSGMNYFTRLEHRRERFAPVRTLLYVLHSFTDLEFVYSTLPLRFKKEMKRLGWDPSFYPQTEGDYMYKEWFACIEYLGGQLSISSCGYPVYMLTVSTYF